MTTLAAARMLVTGASSGIGRAVAERAAARGARLVLTGRDEPRLREVAAGLGPDAAWFAADLGAPERLSALLDRVLADGPPDVVVHSAGLGLAAGAGTTPADRIDAVLTANLVAPVRITERLVPEMVRAGRGHLVFLTSVAGLLGAPREAVYSASKAGLHGYARSLGTELAPAGVKVTAVAPGAVATPFFTRRGEPYTRRFPRPLPVGRVADAVVDAVERDRTEVVLPGWLRAAAVVGAAAPQTYHRLARRWA